MRDQLNIPVQGNERQKIADIAVHLIKTGEQKNPKLATVVRHCIEEVHKQIK